VIVKKNGKKVDYLQENQQKIIKFKIVNQHQVQLAQNPIQDLNLDLDPNQIKNQEENLKESKASIKVNIIIKKINLHKEIIVVRVPQKIQIHVL
jgi:hypothetical protein